jgi:hypothetical protein
VDNNWFKIWPSKLRALVSSLPTGRMRANMTLLIMTYLDEGGLPDHDGKLSFLTGLPIEDIQDMRPYFEFLGKCADGRLYLDFAEELLLERIEFAEKKASAGAKRWTGKTPKDSSAKTSEAKQSNAKKKRAQLSTAKHGLTQLNTAKHNLTKQTDRHTDMYSGEDKSSPGADALADGLPIQQLEPDCQERESKGRKSDPLFEIFCELFTESHNGDPYGYTTADFVQLANLRKRYAKAKPHPMEITPERFKPAAQNYFASNIANETFADLCSRFAVFYKGALDRFNHTVPISNGHSLPVAGRETPTHYADGREKPAEKKGFVY